MKANPYSLLSKNTAKLVRRIKRKYFVCIPLFWCFLFSMVWSSTVIEGIGDTSVASVVIGEPDPLEFILTDIAHVSCFGGSIALLSMLVQEEVGVYNYHWSHGDSTEVVIYPSAVDYSTTIIDYHICDPKFDFLNHWEYNDTICSGAIDVPFILYGNVPDSCTYLWTLENVDLMTLDTLDPEDVTEVLIDFPEAGEFEVCVSATNLHASTVPVCHTVWVLPLTPMTTLDTICKREPYHWLGPFGEILETYDGFVDDWGFGMDPNPDPFEDVRTTENQYGCIVDAHLELYVIPDNFLPRFHDEEYFQEVICFGDYFEMPDGSVYTQTGIYGTEGDIFIPQQNFPQCDSFFILELSVLEVRLSWDDPICKDNGIFIYPASEPFPPEFLPGGAEQDIYIHWVRMSDNDTLCAGAFSAGTFIDCLVWEISPGDFNSDMETFEATIIMDIDGEPDPGCLFGPWQFTIDLKDFSDLVPDTPGITGPETVIKDSLLALMATLPSGESDTTLNYHWTIHSDPDDFTLINDGANGLLQLVFHNPGIYEICASAIKGCRPGKRFCVDILVEDVVSVVELDGEEWGMKIFPNPAEDHLIVESDDLSGKIEISIIDLSGKLLKSYTEVFDTRSLIRLDNIPAGMYFIQIHREGTSVQQAFYKN